MPFGIDDIAYLGAAALGSGSSLLGGMFGAAGQAATNAQQMQFNSYQAQLNREWQEHMASTGYVRAMTDMRNAGLNPILAATLGPSMGGSGATASATLGNPGASMMEGMTNAGQLFEKAAGMKATVTQADKDRSQVGLNAASEGLQNALNTKAVQDTATSASQMRMADAQAQNYAADTQNKIIQNAIYGHDVNTAKAMSDLKTIEADLMRKYGQGPGANVLGTIDRTGNTIKRTLDERVQDIMRGFKQPDVSPSPSPKGKGFFDTPDYSKEPYKSRIERNRRENQ